MMMMMRTNFQCSRAMTHCKKIDTQGTESTTFQVYYFHLTGKIWIFIDVNNIRSHVLYFGIGKNFGRCDCASKVTTWKGTPEGSTCFQQYQEVIGESRVWRLSVHSSSVENIAWGAYINTLLYSLIFIYFISLIYYLFYRRRFSGAWLKVLAVF